LLSRINGTGVLHELAELPVDRVPGRLRRRRQLRKGGSKICKNAVEEATGKRSSSHEEMARLIEEATGLKASPGLSITFKGSFVERVCLVLLDSQEFSEQAKRVCSKGIEGFEEIVEKLRRRYL
jgi:hypothetical protein